MAVISAGDLWWAVWWPWMLLWAVTALAALAALWVLVAHARARGWLRASASRVPGISFYLDDESVMDLYRQGDYKIALRQEVEEKIRSSKDASISSKIYGVAGKGSRSVNREVFRKWIEEAEPIAVIGAIVDVLERANVVVRVDLRRQHVLPNRALRNALRESPGAAVQLSQLGPYVEVMGQFRTLERAEETTVVVAPYGDGELPRARLACATGGLRTRASGGTFRARCLGVVEEWDAEAQELVLHPIAIFQ